MYNNNKSKKYYLCNYNKADAQWCIIETFTNKNEMIAFVAHSVHQTKFDGWGAPKTDNTFYWHSTYFDFLSMNDNDMTPGGVVWKRIGADIQMLAKPAEPRYYRFYDEDFRTIDIREMKPEIFAYIYARDAKLLPGRKYKPFHWHYYAGHKCTHYRTNGHLYTRFRNTHDEYDEDFDYQYKVKAKDREAKYKWRDDFWTRGETGWKTHKNKKQWMHKTCKHSNAWVDNNVVKRHYDCKDIFDDENN